MKHIPFILLMSLCLSIFAQDGETTYYHSLDYMKVEADNQDDYIKMEAAWKKIHAAKIKAGNQVSWALSAVVSPSGAHTEYNFITRTTFAGEKALANHYEGSFWPDNWQSLLTPEELELVNRTGSLRTLVKTEVWAQQEFIYNADTEPKVVSFNYFDFPEGKTREDHMAMETELWKPIHQAKLDAGDLSGWALLSLRMPTGAGMPYHDATVDIYENMEDYLKGTTLEHFQKAHPDMKAEDAMKRTSENGILLKGEVWMLMDRISASDLE